MTSDERRDELLSYAKLNVKGRSRCEWFVLVLDKAARLVEDEGGLLDPEEELMIDDLTAVLIGEGLLAGRGHGPHYIEHNGVDFADLRGASGFKHELRDNSFQVHHAMAALHIGYHYGVPGHLMAIREEDEPQDDALYNLLCPIGISMNWGTTRYFQVASAVYKAIADPRKCSPPPRREDPLFRGLNKSKTLVTDTPESETPNLVLIRDKPNEDALLRLPADVLFSFDSSTLRPEAGEILKRAVNLIKKRSKRGVTVIGYTDSVGTQAHNLQLSLKRAQAVKSWLAKNGVSGADQFQTKGLGEAQPAAPNKRSDGKDNPEGRKLNRRVEILFQK